MQIIAKIAKIDLIANRNEDLNAIIRHYEAL